ncbi:hypothetical protein PHYBOEH_007407 [Phytophthora boehmeriae]|uniref:Uncharacterized protein n=1 Tax=Phytophthora boehmeriae TaxID=109152 RepID=A0A8T1WD66_9STRA|nr:hypothetical protein PHYBOEH_007407 [Phytophthora boehmeriae]
MPLFDSIESDVTAFFVSQGSVFDALVKSFMDRMAHVESRVELLRSEVTNNFTSVHQRIEAHSVAAAEVSATTAAAVAATAASAALSSLSVVEVPTPSVVSLVDGGGRNEELEYYLMTLSRQLNMVLEVLFQPQENNVVEVVQAKQTQLHSISDVLTENEAILMQLAIQHDDAKASTTESHSLFDPGAGLHGSTQGDQLRKTLDRGEGNSTQTTQHQPTVSESTQTTDAEKSRPRQLGRSTRHVVETISPQLEVAPLTAKEEAVRKASTLHDNQSSTRVRSERGDDSDDESDDERIDQMPDDSSFKPLLDGAMNRRKSFFVSCQDMQRSEEDRLREQKLRDDELMRRMQELLLQQSHAQKQQENVEEIRMQQETMEVWRQQQAEANNQQQLLVAQLQEQLQTQMQIQLEQQENRDQEYFRQQEDQRGADIAAIQHEFDRKLEAFSTLVATAQATYGHELAQALQLINEFEKRFISHDALKAAGELWLKTASDSCIYGANTETLSTLQQDFLGFQSKLSEQAAVSTAMVSLREAVGHVVEFLQAPTTDMAGPEQESTMYTLRQLLAKVDSAYRSASTAHDGAQLPNIEFLSSAIHQMELGTANLLDAVDFQQEHSQQISSQQQSGLEKLQNELWRQQEVEKALRVQLGVCPSKEDTLRLVQELRDQITVTTADSTARMLDTVDDLRLKMSGLPNSQMLEQLANDLHSKADRITLELDSTVDKMTQDLQQKADRSEIDRLQSLVEANNSSNAPPICLTKSPLRCLSCDQHLPFAQAPPDDNTSPERGGSPPRSPSSSPPRPIIYHNHHQHIHQPSHHHQPETYADFGINTGILEELFAASTSALERRRRQRQHLQLQLSSPESNFGKEFAFRKPLFMNIDDGRNRIPLRKTQLSDQVIYGPAITPNTFRKKQMARSDDNARPKTAVLPDRRSGGEIITRTSSSTVIVRPFAELTDKRFQKK